MRDLEAQRDERVHVLPHNHLKEGGPSHLLGQLHHGSIFPDFEEYIVTLQAFMVRWTKRLCGSCRNGLDAVDEFESISDGSGVG